MIIDELENYNMFIPNKTKLYLLPCIKYYGNTFITKISNIFKVAVGIEDLAVVNTLTYNYNQHLFILIDTTKATPYFIDFIYWIREQPMYEDDYVYGNILKSKLHMVVIKIPDKYKETLLKFKDGKYSSMYNKEDFIFFNSYPDVKKVLEKDESIREKFITKVNTDFDLEGKYSIKPKEWTGEFDYPPTPKTDIFNHHLKVKTCQ